MRLSPSVTATSATSGMLLARQWVSRRPTSTIYATRATTGQPKPAQTLAELKQRLGHDSDRAASIYLHSPEERQHTIADALSDRAGRDLRRRDASTDRLVMGTGPIRPRPRPIGHVTGTLPRTAP